MRAIEEDEFDFKHEHLMTYKYLIYLQLRNNDAIFTQDNKVDIYTDGEEKFHELIKDIDKATDHVHLLYYIIRHDELGKRIADVLIKKAKEGVEVRLLYDDMGSRLLSRRYIKRLKNAGVHVDAFFPPKIPKLNLKIRSEERRVGKE